MTAEVTIGPGEERPARFRGRIFNVSRGGVALFCEHAVGPGKLVAMELFVRLPETGVRRVALFGVTRWMAVLPDGNLVGIELFADAEAGDYAWFLEHVSARLPIVRRPASGTTGRRGGFTMVELCVAMVIVCLMTTLAAPIFTRAIEQARVDAAAANLKTVWSAQRVYWLEHRSYAPDLAALRSMDLIDAGVADSASSPTAVYAYDIVSADATTFEARALRNGSGRWSGQMQIDQDGSIEGSVSGSGGQVLTPAQ